jgi:hypothetical protein
MDASGGFDFCLRQSGLYPTSEGYGVILQGYNKGMLCVSDIATFSLYETEVGVTVERSRISGNAYQMICSPSYHTGKYPDTLYPANHQRVLRVLSVIVIKNKNNTLSALQFASCSF